jgi:hypothetical protein
VLLAALAHRLSRVARTVRHPWHASCLLLSPATILR